MGKNIAILFVKNGCEENRLSLIIFHNVMTNVTTVILLKELCEVKVAICFPKAWLEAIYLSVQTYNA